MANEKGCALLKKQLIFWRKKTYNNTYNEGSASATDEDPSFTDRIFTDESGGMLL